MRMPPPIELLNEASEKLGDLCQEVVFLGGAVVSLLVSERGGLPPRVTKDVDVAIELGGTLLDTYELDRRLLDLGFQNDMTGPVCRYLHGSCVLEAFDCVAPTVHTWREQFSRGALQANSGTRRSSV